MYVNALIDTHSYTHISLYMAWRVPPSPPAHGNLFLGLMDDIGPNNDFEYTKIFVIL